MDELGMHNHREYERYARGRHAARSPHTFIAVVTGLVLGVDAAGARNTVPEKPTIGHPTMRCQCTAAEDTHALGVGPEEKVGMDIPQATCETPTTAAMRNISKRLALVKAIDTRNEPLSSQGS